jgi:hypothetical protein
MMSRSDTREMILARVNVLFSPWKLRMKIDREGRKRNRSAKIKKGATPTQAHENFVEERATGALPFIDCGSLVVTLTIKAPD